MESVAYYPYTHDAGGAKIYVYISIFKWVYIYKCAYVYMYIYIHVIIEVWHRVNEECCLLPLYP
jgi:hypothetical protein